MLFRPTLNTRLLRLDLISMIGLACLHPKIARTLVLLRMVSPLRAWFNALLWQGVVLANLRILDRKNIKLSRKL
jgi:hypothetical protein